MKAASYDLLCTAPGAEIHSVLCCTGKFWKVLGWHHSFVIAFDSKAHSFPFFPLHPATTHSLPTPLSYTHKRSYACCVVFFLTTVPFLSVLFLSHFSNAVFAWRPITVTPTSLNVSECITWRKLFKTCKSRHFESRCCSLLTFVSDENIIGSYRISSNTTSFMSMWRA